MYSSYAMGYVRESGQGIGFERVRGVVNERDDCWACCWMYGVRMQEGNEESGREKGRSVNAAAGGGVIPC